MTQKQTIVFGKQCWPVPPGLKSHGDDLGLEYLWNEDEYSSLENSFKAVKKMQNIEENKKS